MENISKIRKKNICISCEGCKAICPVSAIEIEYKNGKYVPYVDEKSCIECGKCLKICYGNHIETNGIDIGEYIEVYDAYVPHEKLRKRSTSGGVISRLLTALIQDNKVDGAFVLNFDPSINKPARLAFVKDKESVYEASSSKYIPGSVFNILGKIEEEGTYAIVGTPCQFYTIKNYIEEKCLESNILYLGLFCDRTMNFNFIKYMEDKFGKNRENLINIDYRNKEKRGWPGDIKLYFDSGREVIVDRKKRTEVKDYFMLERCLYCTDKLNRHADISFGDCYIHGKEYPERTSVIVRTPKGKEVFERYSNLFVVNESSLKSVIRVQNIQKREKHLKRAKKITSHNITKKLKRKRRKIRMGEKYSKKLLELSLIKSKIKFFSNVLKDYLKVIGHLLINPRKEKRNKMKNILITGGQLSNKGAQAMTFTATSQMLEYDSSYEIYLLSVDNKDYKRDEVEKNKYPFKIIPWDTKEKLKILKNNNHSSKEIFKNTKMILDVSGYRLHHSFTSNGRVVYNYLFNIYLAKKFSIPYYILPQSIGPFNHLSPTFPLVWSLLKKYLKYPEIICPREKAGVKSIKKFASNNVKRRHDIVLTDGYNISSVYDGEIKDIGVNEPAIGIVPNTHVSRRIEHDKLMSFYKKAIKNLRKVGFNVYLIRHSNEDLSIIKDLKDMFQKDNGVVPVTEELYSFELEDLISKLEFMIASRYHSIIHAYRNGVPCLVLGWAVKYLELLNDFSQSEYVFDVREGINVNEILEKMEKLIEKYPQESEKVKINLERIQKEEGNIFEKKLDDFSKTDNAIK